MLCDDVVFGAAGFYRLTTGSIALLKAKGFTVTNGGFYNILIRSPEFRDFGVGRVVKPGAKGQLC